MLRLEEIGRLPNGSWGALQQKGFRVDKAKKYVLYCAHGMQSAHLAEKMQRFGYEAYSFKGGTARLMKYLGNT